MNFFKDVLIPFATAVGGYIVRVLFVKIKKQLKKNFIKNRFWRFKGDKMTIICSDYKENYVNGETLGYREDVWASAKISYILRDVYDKEPDMYHGIKQCATVVNGNVVAVGGPKHNDYSTEIMSQKFYPFCYDKNKLIIKKSEILEKITEKGFGEEIDPIEDDEKKIIKEDYTIIVNSKNPIDENGRVVLISGCKSVGIKAGIAFIENITNYKEDLKEIFENTDSSFYILLEVKNGMNIGVPKIIASGTFND